MIVALVVIIIIKVVVQTKSIPENETYKIHWDFEIQLDHLILARRPKLSDSKEKKKEMRIWRTVDFVVPKSKKMRKTSQRT